MDNLRFVDKKHIPYRIWLTHSLFLIILYI